MPSKIPVIRLPGLSVVIPHGGRERLPQLAASLANLAQCDGLDELIVVELGSHAHARPVAARWGARYVFVRHEGPFERARALNVGTAIAARELVMWKDNDLLLPPHFAACARAEMERLGLDFFLPYAYSHHLGPDDSHEVMRGTRDPAGCQPMEVFRGGDSNGAAGIVRARFVDRVGGLEEGFRGWGYEDYAWWHKARLLGRTAVTQDRRQVLYHLHHPTAVRDPALFAANQALFRQMQSIGSAQVFLAQYPPPRFASCPWPVERRILFIAAPPAVRAAQGVTQVLYETYGIACEVLSFDPQCTEADAAFTADALVLFGEGLARMLLAQPRYVALACKALVVADPTIETAPGAGSDRGRVGSTPTSAAQRWTPPTALVADPLPRHAVLTCVEPLSQLLGRPQDPHLDAAPPLPVWAYW